MLNNQPRWGGGGDGGVCVWGGGGGGGGRRGNLGVIVVRVFEPVFRDLLLSYTWHLKKRPIHILDRLKC